MLNKIIKLIGICLGLNTMIVFGSPEAIEDENGNLIGLKLHLPTEFVNDCENKFWNISDESLKQKLEEATSTEENFHNWCNIQQEIDFDNSITLRMFYCCCAYIFKRVNEKNYLIPLDFCQRIQLNNVLDSIHLKGAIRCMPTYTTPTEKYIRSVGWLIDC